MNEFLIAEFGKLRDEIIFTIKGIVDCEKFAMIVTAGFWTFFLNCDIDKYRYLYIALYWLPFFLILLLKFKRDFLDKHTIKIGKYIQIIEKEIIGDENIKNKGLGWEHSIPVGKLESWVKYFWIFILSGNFALASYFTIYSIFFKK